jgi:hypothetical protein
MKLVKIRKKEILNYKGKVYDLKVEDDSSYNINNILVHNSDYVMIGGIFNKALESSGENYLHNIKISPKLAKFLYKRGFKVKKHYYGMSTKIAQKKMGKTKLKTSEGVERFHPIEYTLEKWTENFVDYLRSSMSYSNAHNLDEYIGNAKYVFITENAFNRFNK